MAAAPSWKRAKPVVPDRLDLRDRVYQPLVGAVPSQSANSLRMLREASRRAQLRAIEAEKAGNGGALEPGTTRQVVEAREMKVKGQRKSKACTGFALAQVANYLLRRSGREPHAETSPWMLYSMARRYDRFEGSTQDTGSSLRGALKGWYKHGVCEDALWTTRLSIPEPNKDPERDWWQNAVRRPLGAYYRIDPRSVSDMHVAIHDVGVILASARCHDGWEVGHALDDETRDGWVIPYEPGVSTPSDGHAFVIVGYNARGFLVLNSWSSRWGDEGLATLRYEDWLDNAMDCWVAQLGVVTDREKRVASAATIRWDAGDEAAGRAPRVRIAKKVVLRDREIAPFVVNLENSGRLSTSGTFRTQVSDLDALSSIHIPAARKRWGLSTSDTIDIAIYADGGLTAESESAATIARWLPDLYENEIFPIFFMRENDLWTTLAGRLADIVAVPKPDAGAVEPAHVRFRDQRLERGVAAVGTMFWRDITKSARNIARHSAKTTSILARLMGQVAKFDPGPFRLHLIGHSAGAIVQTLVADRLASTPNPVEIASVTLLAPAVSTEVFRSKLLPHLQAGKVAQLSLFYLRDELEQADPDCLPRLGYGRSLLYLVSESFHGGQRTPILGMEKYVPEALEGAPEESVRKFTAPDSHCGATTHRGFSDDPLTRKTVVELVKQAAAAG